MSIKFKCTEYAHVCMGKYGSKFEGIIPLCENIRCATIFYPVNAVSLLGNMTSNPCILLINLHNFKMAV